MSTSITENLPPVEFAEQKVSLVGSTNFHEDECPYPLVSEDFNEVGGGAKVAEVGGRLCYQSFGTDFAKRPTAEYLDNIMEMGHGSVLEHANYSLLIEGVSRNCTHELVRHRHFGFSQRSQRYCDESDAKFIMPPALKEFPADHPLVIGFVTQCAMSLLAYNMMVQGLQNEFEAQMDGEPTREEKRDLRKKVNQTARFTLSSAVETKILVTGNVRMWTHFLTMRGHPAADAEIRSLAIQCLNVLQSIAHPMFDHFEVQGDCIVGKYAKP